MLVKVIVRQVRVVEAVYEYEFSDKMVQKEATALARRRAMEMAKAHAKDEELKGKPWAEVTPRDVPRWHSSVIEEDENNKRQVLFPIPRVGEL